MIRESCNHLTLDPSPQGEGVGALTGMAASLYWRLRINVVKISFVVLPAAGSLLLEEKG